MDPLTGIWRLAESNAWDEAGNSLPAPYGKHPVGHIVFTAEGRMLAALCNGDDDPVPGADRGYSSYGGFYTLDGITLTVAVDMASDTRRIGGHQVREATFDGGRLRLRPPMRAYGGVMQQRELLWERVWQPADSGTKGPGGRN